MQTFWVYHGQRLPGPEAHGDIADEPVLVHRHGYVKVSEGQNGITLRWCVCAPNWASLHWLMSWLPSQQGPVTLQYFLAGWFTETVETPLAAVDRLDAILAKSDIHLRSRTFVSDAVPPRRKSLPPVLLQTVEEGLVSPDNAIVCAYDQLAHGFKVAYIGTSSTIAKLWGPEPFSYPCINGSDYDHVVGQAYLSVLSSGEPHYDQVCASMRSPGEEPFWLPYHRLIYPHALPNGTRGVAVVTEVAKVDIRII